MDEIYLNEVNSKLDEIQSILDTAEGLDDLDSIKFIQNSLEDVFKQYKTEYRTIRKKEKKERMKTNIDTINSRSSTLTQLLETKRISLQKTLLFSNSNMNEEEPLLSRTDEDKERDILLEGSKSLENSKRIMENVLERGEEISYSLGKNRDTLNKAHDRINNTNEGLLQGYGIIENMIKRENYKKNILKISYTIVFFSLIFIFFKKVIYSS